MLLLHKLRTFQIQINEAKAAAAKARCEDRAIRAWLLKENFTSEEQLKKKYGNAIFEDASFAREAAKFSGHVKKEMPSGFAHFITNRQALLRLPSQENNYGWQNFTIPVPVEQPEGFSSSSTTDPRVFYKQKKCAYKIFHGKS